MSPFLTSLIAVVAILWSLSDWSHRTEDRAWAQDRIPYKSVTESERLYREEDAKTIRGTIESIDTVTMSDGAVFTQLRLLTPGDDLVRVHLAPTWFLERQPHRLELDVGRGVEVLGSPATVDEQRVFVAAEVRNDRRDQRLRLRHASGAPVWAAAEYAE